MLTKDQWILDAIAAGRYRVEKSGAVYSRRLDPKAVWRRIKTFVHPKTGYVQFTMSHLNVQKLVTLHRVVALVHVPNPLGLPVVNHDDGNKQNCADTNLIWSTNADNEKHAYRTGLKTHVGEANTQAVLDDAKVRAIRADTAPAKVIAARYGISRRTVQDVQNNRTWRHVC